MTISDNFAQGRVSIDRLCRETKVSRQAYYKSHKKKIQRELDKAHIIRLVDARRKLLPREGGKKLYRVLKPDITHSSVKMGRDKFFDLLREENELIRRRKRYCYTTNSNHAFRKYDNLIKDKLITGKEQVWASDITYIRTMEGFCYLALITDMYSRKIVGYDVSDNLEMEGCFRAMRKALKDLPKEHLLIHHSDRGIQYCCRDYIKLLTKNHIGISMSAKGNCYENALAERVNGILKDEFYLGESFKTKEQAYKVCKDAIEKYNTIRLHSSIGFLTPDQKHIV